MPFPVIALARFNPHSRTGSDRRPGAYIRFRQASIHTPVQGATWKRSSRIGSQKLQSTLPYRERRQRLDACPNPNRLQSTLPYRERPREYYKDLRDNGFNPHSRTGSDADLPPLCLRRHASIHTPVQGATPGGGQRFGPTSASIHTPVQGATYQTFRFMRCGVLQSTLPYRERREVTINLRISSCFNPHSRTGSD